MHAHVPFLSIVIFSEELVLGPDIACQSSMLLAPCAFSSRTDGADDAGPAVVLLWLIVDVEITLPFQLGAIGKMIQSVTHFVCYVYSFSGLCIWLS